MNRKAGQTVGWNGARSRYQCADMMSVTVKLQIESNGARGSSPETSCENTQLCRNGIIYAHRPHHRDMTCTVFVSRIRTSRDVGILSRWPAGVRTAAFPRSVLEVDADAFQECKALNAIVTNEGLLVLGASRCADEEEQRGIFEECPVEKVQLSSTLKRVEPRAFHNCKALRSIEVPEGVEVIGDSAFKGSGLE